MQLLLSGLSPHTLAPGDSGPLPSEFWGELTLWPLGDTSGAETCVVAVVVCVVAAVDAPTASARSGGRSSSSLRLLKAHEALLITTINRLWGVQGGPGGGGGAPQTDVCQMSSLQDPIQWHFRQSQFGLDFLSFAKRFEFFFFYYGETYVIFIILSVGKRTIQWHSKHPQCCVPITTVYTQNFLITLDSNSVSTEQ